MEFKYNSMLNCVDWAYFGHSASGWSMPELFMVELQIISPKRL